MTQNPTATHQPLAVLIIILATVRRARDRIALSNFQTANRKTEYLMVIENIHYESSVVLFFENNSGCHITVVT
jgi:hypothetical protein